MTWQIKPWVALSLIFVLGAITGAALTFGLRPERSRPPGLQEIRSSWLRHLTQRLDLTPDQQSKIQPILEDAGTRIQNWHHDDLDHISRIMQEANDKISPFLTPVQQEKLKQMEQERRDAFPDHKRGRGTPHHHPPMGSAPSEAPPDGLSPH